MQYTVCRKIDPDPRLRKEEAEMARNDIMTTWGRSGLVIFNIFKGTYTVFFEFFNILAISII